MALWMLGLLTAHAQAPVHTLHIDRQARILYVLDAQGAVVSQESVGIGRGGLATKTNMSDLVTPTGDFQVDLILGASGTHDAVSAQAQARFADTPEYARLLTGDPGLSGLFANMNSIDFNGDGQPDGAYGQAYIGLESDTAVTGPKLRRYQGTTPYWFSIALHGTPDPANLGAANSGGCVHLSATLISRLIETGQVRIGSQVHIRDGAPSTTP